MDFEISRFLSTSLVLEDFCLGTPEQLCGFVVGIGNEMDMRFVPGREKCIPLYYRVRRVKGLDVFCGSPRGIIFGRSRLARYWNWRGGFRSGLHARDVVEVLKGAQPFALPVGSRKATSQSRSAH